MKKNYILLLLTLLISVISFGQNAGDIIITEIMQNPNAVADSDGEYFEVYNTTGSAINLDGWTITDNGSNSHLITASVLVNAGDYVVLGKTTDMTINGNTPVDYAYGSDITLSNGDDEIILTSFAGTEIDRVEYDGGPVFPDPGTSDAASMNLNPTSLNATANDDGTNWCLSITAFGDGDKGTPGTANDVCGPPCDLSFGNREATCDAFTTGTDTYAVTIDFTGGGTSAYVITTNAGTIGGDDPATVATGTITITNINEGTDLIYTANNSTTGGSCDLTVFINSPVCIPANCSAVGSVIITEIFNNATGSDTDKEWFEILNTTGSSIDMSGWTIRDDGTNAHTITSLIIPANSYMVLGQSNDTSVNDGVAVDYVYSGFTLGNSTDEVVLDCTGIVIDIVIYDDGITFPDVEGASMELSINHYNATDNDNGAAWCQGITDIGAGNLGTPGAINNCSTTLAITSNEIEGFSIYPNPVTNNRIVMNTLSTSAKNVSIFDILGKQVYTNSFTGTNSVINLGKMNTGVYFLKVTEGSNTSTRKLIIK